MLANLHRISDHSVEDVNYLTLFENIVKFALYKLKEHEN